ncbi:unnamed protein product [Effrenium voratum]|nr:unnamed protein product [Effrenium voratum]
MTWRCSWCLEGALSKLEFPWKPVDLYGDDSPVFANRKDLLELVNQLESIQESRVAVDQCLLADLIRRYDARSAANRVRTTSVVVQSELPEVEDREYKMLPLPTAAMRPILEGTTSSQLLQHLKEDFDLPLHPHFVMRILEMAIKAYGKRNEQQGPLFRVSLPDGGGRDGFVPDVELQENASCDAPRIVVLGDTHGQLGDVLWAISQFGLPSQKNVYVINGDIADRCDWSTEIFMLLLTITLQYPNDTVIVMNRGNHECMTMNGSRCGGFQYELLDKYGATWGPYLHGLFGQLFAVLPLATIIQDAILVIHGGVGRDPEKQLEYLQECQSRESSINPWGIEGDKLIDALVDALWADPGDDAGSQPNPRGTGHVWGPDFTERFLKSTKLKLIIRSHQVPQDQSGVYLHGAHNGKLITVFSASNYRGRKNKAGAVLIRRAASSCNLNVVCHDLGICPSWRVLSDSVNLRPRSGLKSDRVDDELISELLQQSMGLLAEWRVPLWEACTREDPSLKGVISLSSWRRVCRNTTKIYAIDWVLLARLVGGASVNNIRYMQTLNRFGFKIASQVVESELASSVMASIYTTMMRADESLHQLMGKLCQAGKRAAPAKDLLDGFGEILRRNGVSGPEMAAVRRSLQAHIGDAPESSIDIAEFLSAWKCAAGVRAELEGRQMDLACQISRLLGSSARRWRKRLSSLGAANSNTLLLGFSSHLFWHDNLPTSWLCALDIVRACSDRIVWACAYSIMARMDFFNLADVDRDGFVSIDEGFNALMKHLRQTTGREVLPSIAEDLRGLLQMADSTGSGKLNYLEFLSLFDFQDPRSLTHQAVLDLLCFQVWVHRNALSGLFRYIGTNGVISREQVRWSLEALNTSVQGDLLQANIDQIVNAVKFKDDVVAGEELLSAFQLVDKHG